MELDLAAQHANRAYAILSGLVTPRPIALVTTLGPDGVVNAAPFSFFNVFGSNPPIARSSSRQQFPSDDVQVVAHHGSSGRRIFSIGVSCRSGWAW